MDDPRCWNDLAAENARLREALRAFVGRDRSCLGDKIRLVGNEIRIVCDSRGDAICRVANARTAIGETHAQAPFDHEGAPR